MGLAANPFVFMAPHAGLPPQFFPPSLQFYAQSGQEKPSENGVSVSENAWLKLLQNVGNYQQIPMIWNSHTIQAALPLQSPA